MKGIFLVLIFLVLGVGLGVIFGNLLYKLRDWFLRRKISKKATQSKKHFQYKDKVYDIKQEIEKQLIEFNTMKINRRKKRMKGGNKHNGNTIQSGSNEGVENQGTDERVEQTEGSSSSAGNSAGNSTDNSTGNTTDSREESRQVINRNLLKRGRKFN